jgi:uncharacterized repeat protein (TIGR01451 family)
MVGLVLPASAAPNTVVGTGDSLSVESAVTVTDSLASIDGPGHHFGFTAVTNQAVASLAITKTDSPDPVTAGSNLTYTIVVSTGATFPATNVTVTDTLPAGLTLAQVPTITGGTSGACTGTVGATAVTCTITTLAANSTATITIVALVAASTANNTILTNTANVTGTVNAVEVTSTATQTTTVSTTGQAVTAANALPVLQGLGFTGVATNACASLIGQACQVTGAITGSATITGSASWNITVPAAPANALVGGIPAAFALTTTNPVAPGEGPFACAALAVAGGPTTCNFVTTGNPLNGTTVAVCFPTAAAPVCVVGTVTGPGARPPVILPNLPILPPPPLEFIPPPPPPLLPPPPPAPTGALAAPRAAFPEVPVIPEADSLFLVIGGLVALGGLVGYRSLRRRRDDDIT